MFDRAITDAIVLFLAVVVALLAAAMSAQFLGLSPHATALFGSIAIGATAALVHRFFTYEGKLPTLDPGASDPSTMLFAVLTGVGLAALGTGLLALEQIIPSVAEHLATRAQHFEVLLAPDNAAMIPIVILVIAVGPGVSEEFIFRGVMRARLQSISTNRRIAVVSTLFVVLHLDPVIWGPMIPIAIGLTIIAERSGGFVASAAAHMTLNTVNGVLTPRILPDAIDVPLACALVAGGAIVAVFAVRAIPVSPRQLPPRSPTSL